MKLISTTITILAILISSSGIQAKGYAGSPTVERRARVSGTTTCYYQCPETVNDAENGQQSFDGTAADGDNTRCLYPEGGECVYNTASGSLVSSKRISDCPSQAPEGGCGAEPDGGFRKRGTYSLGRARDNQAIVDRQFKYRSNRSAKPIQA